MAKTVLAIVGRPNVGKSTLFNKLAGERVSIVEDIPGITRDRIYFDTEWNGRPITVIDTGGIEPKTDDIILSKMKMQAELAIETADVIAFVCDVRAGLTAADRDIAVMLIKSGKPVVLCVNKIDSIGSLPMEYYEFYELGFDGDPIALSSLHGTGTGDLLDRVLELAPSDGEEEEEDDSIKVAVIGKPNAGKSSIINKILGEDRVIVSDIPGTTRDAIDTKVENEYGKYTFIDTAGIRRQKKVIDRVEKYSVLRSHSAVERADVCLIMIDATAGITEQDEKIAGLSHEAGKAAIIVVNKWDLVEKDNSSVKKFTDNIREALAYMPYAPIIFVSAKTGQRLNKLFALCKEVKANAEKRITTGLLNDVISSAVRATEPPTKNGRRLKIYYAVQDGVCPPSFVFFVNNSELMHFSYKRFLENTLRKSFGFEGTPIRIFVREKSDRDL